MSFRNSFLKIINLGIVILLCCGFTSIVYSATTATVTATVTVQNISVSVADGIVSYGTLSTSDTQDTTSSGLNDSQTATNNGNIDEDFSIKGQDSSNWTLATSIGSEQYAHKFCTSSCDSSPVWTALTTTNQSLATSVATSGTQEFDLQILTPSSTANYTQQSVDVVVTASAS
jgi:hypothetical protein